MEIVLYVAIGGFAVWAYQAVSLLTDCRAHLRNIDATLLKLRPFDPDDLDTSQRQA